MRDHTQLRAFELVDSLQRIWPRRLLRSVLPGHGLFMLIEARK